MTSFTDGFVLPAFTDDAAAAREIVQREGAVVLRGTGSSKADAASLGRLVFGDDILAAPPPVKVLAGGEYENRPEDADALMRLHVDGFAYGDRLPDYVGLTCVEQSDAGGDSFLFDAYHLLAAAGPTGDRAAFQHFVRTVQIEHTQEGMQHSVSLLAMTGPGGRIVIRRSHPQTIVDPDSNGRHAAALRWWDELLEEAALSAPRFKLAAGDTLLVDNFRVFHGRDPFHGRRMLWRTWVWTTASVGLPEQALASDSRYATRELS